MGIDENYFVVLFIAEGKVTQPCPRAVAFEQKCELKQSKIWVFAFQPSTLLLSQTSSLDYECRKGDKGQEVRCWRGIHKLIRQI